jgi:low temperature requirement protein LtrA
MVARDTAEAERVSSPLELLFDLTFVVAVAQLSTQFGRQVEAGNGIAELLPFIMVFFAIWWAWINFTWFASAYDADDVSYRLLTLVQMAGVLVLAAGVPSALTSANFLGITIGYFIMRVGLVAQWTRAGIENPDGRATALRYAAGITIVQLGWLLRLLLPTTPTARPYTVYLAFFVLAALEIAVPAWAERTGKTTWHAHHIAERYGLFTIILLGEAVASLAAGVGLILDSNRPTAALIVVGIAALVLIFAMWWVYFLQPAGEGLDVNRDASYLWGYGHYFVFLSLAGLAAGLDVVLASAGGELELPATAAGYAIAIPVAVYLFSLWLVHVPVAPTRVVRIEAVLPFSIVILAVPLASAGIGLVGVFVLIVVVAIAAVVTVMLIKRRALAPTESGGDDATRREQDQT